MCQAAAHLVVDAEALLALQRLPTELQHDPPGARGTDQHHLASGHWDCRSRLHLLYLYLRLEGGPVGLSADGEEAWAVTWDWREQT